VTDGAKVLALHVERVVLPLDRLAFQRKEAAEVLGVSVDYFDEHLRPFLRAVRSGRLCLFPKRELERFLEDNATRAPVDALDR
jgi:excisionase family DNA binding protein